MTPYKNGIPKNHNLLGTTLHEVPRFITKKWVEVDEQSGNAEARYKPSRQIRFKTSMLRSDLCDFSDAYIVVKGDITVTNPNNAKRNKAVAFKNNAPFINCISKINGVKIDNAEDLDVVMSMYNSLEYSKNYRKTTGRLWNYYRDEPNNPPFKSPVGNNPPTVNYNTEIAEIPITNSASFKYKNSIKEKTSNVNQEDGEDTRQGNRH